VANALFEVRGTYASFDRRPAFTPSIRPDRHNLSPQQYFFGCAIVRYRHLSTSIAYFKLNTFGVRYPKPSHVQYEYDLMNQKPFDA
jgi:hypothetical protein